MRFRRQPPVWEDTLERAAFQIRLLTELLAPDRDLSPEGREAEALRRMARAAFEDWYEARVRAEIDRRKGQACSDVGTAQTRR